MKKIFTLLSAAILLSTAATFAQSVAKENVLGEQTTETQKFEADESVDARSSGVEANFNFVDAGFTYGMAMIFNHFVIHSDYLSFFDEPEGVTSFTSWNIGAGYNYRHFFSKSFYMDARGGLQYTSTTLEYKSSMNIEDYKGGTFDLYVMPKVGLRLTGGFALVAGYKITFVDFGDVGGSFNVGLSFLM